jgi:hypothetical protein
MSTMQGDEVRRWAEALLQAERTYWELVSRYIVLKAPVPGEPRKSPSRVFDVAAIREFETAEINRRKAADSFHAMLRRRARAMEE